MKLLLFTNLFPTPYDPERGIFTLQLVKRLMHHCEVTVVCPLPWFPKWKILQGFTRYAQFSKTPTRYEIDGITVHSPKYPLIPKLSENYHAFFMTLGISRYIRKLHQKIGFDVVNSHWLYPDSVAIARVLENIPIPHIATGLGCDINHETYQPVKGQKILDTLSSCEAITVVSQNLKQELVNHNIDENKITVIPNGIDTSRFGLQNRDNCRASLGIISKAPMVLYVGRLSEEKNISALIRATSILAQENNTMMLYLVGDGPLRSQLNALVNELGIENSVIFVGKVSHDQVSLWMGAADFFCLPSLREGCPNVILEALGSGKPVIASRVGAIPEVVTEKSGILFTPGNIDELSDSLKAAFGGKWSPQNISNSVKNLSWEHAANHYAEVFEQATTRQGSRCKK